MTAMKQAKKIAEGRNYTAADIGDAEDIKSYSLIHAKTGQEVRGKLFLKELTRATGTEISFNSIPPGSGPRVFPQARQRRRNVHNTPGAGYCQVDGDCFPVKAGSVIRVAPAGVRGLCNTSQEEMVYLCIQSRENSLEKHTYDDGTRVACTPLWKKR